MSSKFPLAFVDDEDNVAAFVFDPPFSAMRDSAGAWTSPASKVCLGDLEEDEYILASASLTMILVKEARMATSVTPLLTK